MIKYPDYENCIVNLACSVLKEFGVNTGENKGLPICEALFEKQYKNIALKTVLNDIIYNILKY